MNQIELLDIVTLDQSWVLAELETLYSEWKDWEATVARIVDQPYDKSKQSDVFADGEENMKRHDILQAKTLTFLDQNIKGHGFIKGINGDRIDRTDLRLKIRVKHRIHNLEVLRASLRYRRNTQSGPKEKEQKFGIVCSLKQASFDFATYMAAANTAACGGVLFFDIDHFKTLNTEFTESTVDPQLLAPFQHLLNRLCANRGGTYRQGGDEFLIILANHSPEEVLVFAERLRTQVEAHEFSVNSEAVRITVSVGVAYWPRDGSTFDELLNRANQAEHVAKSKGRNQVSAYDGEA